ncbi:hypothetical protein LguiB_015844 [Lonicera macranthoides]
MSKSNPQRLHRQLKDIPNYTLHLPPKRIFSSITEVAFVHQRCIQLDKYLQDLLSIANAAEQHEVWDFLSVSSKREEMKDPLIIYVLIYGEYVELDDGRNAMLFCEPDDGGRQRKFERWGWSVA